MKRRSLVLSLAVALALVGSAAARPPANDAFSAAIAIAGEAGSIAGSNIDATHEPGEPDHGGDEGGGGSVWYRWTAPSSRPYVFRTCRRDRVFDSLLNVYTGSTLDSLIRITRNDDACGTGSAVAVPAVAGTTYSIAVTTFEGDPGSFVLEWEPAEPPKNDSFATPLVLTGRSGTSAATMRFSTRETGEPSHGSGAGSVWFTWAPTESGVVRFSASRELNVAVYLGDTLTSLRLAALATAQRHAVAFEALPGTVYRIAFAGPISAVGGDFWVDWTNEPQPVNDAFERPYVLNGDAGVTTVSIVASTLETGEPAHGNGPETGSVWFAWRPDRGGRVAFTVCPAGATVSAALYVGDALSSLSRLDATVGTCRTAGRLAFVAAPGTTYRLAVAGLRTSLGAVTLEWGAPPANDDFADARAIGGDAMSVEGTTTGATRELGEGEHREGGTGSVWYSWTAPASGPFVVDTCKHSVDAHVVVYAGAAWSTLDPVASDRSPTCDDAGSAVRLDAVAGTTYRVAVVSTEDSFGAFTLRVRRAPVPANDALAAALHLRGMSGAVDATTIAASREPREPRHASESGGSVWFRWTAPRDSWVAFDTCTATEGATLIAAYRHSSTARLRRVALGDDECYPHDRLFIRVRAGVAYRIAVAAYAGAGDFTLRWAATAPPECRVPYVVGMKLAAALRVIAARHCRAAVRRVNSKLVRRGRVIAQSPNGGQRRPHGAIVRLEVAG